MVSTSITFTDNMANIDHLTLMNQRQIVINERPPKQATHLKKRRKKNYILVLIGKWVIKKWISFCEKKKSYF